MMRTKFLTRINALIVLILGALGIGSCHKAPECKYGPPPENDSTGYQSDDIEELYGIPMPPEDEPAP